VIGRVMADTGGAARPKGRRARQQFAARLAATCALIGYTEEDGARVRATGEVIRAHAGAVADVVYEQLLSRPETAVHFVRDGSRGGRGGRAYVAERSDALQAWLRLAVEAPLDEELAAHLAGIGRSHTARGGDPGVRVKGRFLLAAMSVVQAALADVLAREAESPREAARTIAAWNKLLMVHLDLLLAVYGAAEGNPHWY
jgi:hypothetical protein